ncbi:MAG: PQQ-binding-like beta-propeller repeat protein [Ktedonobacteraceae bacterium]|nr:PQQ-binding-like beta-propeller repeat protein [Ktedonobacteraceae bacterium]
MDKYNEHFTPETVDEHVEALLQSQPPTTADGQIVQDLHRLYTEDVGTLEHVWQRLGLDTHISYTNAVRHMNTSQRQGGHARMISHERNHPMLLHSTTNVPKRRAGRSLAVLAAMFIAAILVGSAFVIFSHRAAPSQSTASSQPSQIVVKTPSGVYVGGDNGIARIDIKTGKQLWKYNYPSTPSGGLYSKNIIPLGNMLYVCMQSYTMHAQPAVLALDAQTGKLRWSRTFGSAALDSLTAAGDMLYAGVTDPQPTTVTAQAAKRGSGPSVGASTSLVYALNAANGTQHATYTLNGDVQTLAVANKVLYVGASNGLHALSLSDGKRLWYTVVKGLTVSIGTPFIVNHVLYTTITDQSEVANLSTSIVAAFNPATGGNLWQSDSIHSQLYDLTIAGNRIFVGTMMAVQGGFKGSLRVYDVQTGKLVWNTALDGSVQSAPAVDANQVYVSAFSSLRQREEVVALTIATGKIKWTAHVAAGSLTAPKVINRVVYASTDHGGAGNSTISALNASDGSQLWTTSSIGITSSQALMVAH